MPTFDLVREDGELVGVRNDLGAFIGIEERRASLRERVTDLLGKDFSFPGITPTEATRAERELRALNRIRDALGLAPLEVHADGQTAQADQFVTRDETPLSTPAQVDAVSEATGAVDLPAAELAPTTRPTGRGSTTSVPGVDDVAGPGGAVLVGLGLLAAVGLGVVLLGE